MEPADGGDKWPLSKKKKKKKKQKESGWHRRFHLRKTADQPPTMQSGDKQGPKTIAEEWQTSAAWPSSKKPPQAAQRRTNVEEEEDPLRFLCSLCTDSAEYVPKDLVGHFEEQHRGSPPVFCCRTCTFSTHEFSYLQVHLLSHKDTFSSCALCKDNVQRTWSEFRAHLAAFHFRNGKYSCQMCPKFSTGDAGLFLEHTYAHSLTLEGAKDDVHAEDKTEFVLKAAAQTLRCQHCGYEVSRKLLINNDIQAVHICSGDRLKEAGGAVGPALVTPDRPGPKKQLRLTRSAVREMCWLTQDCLALPGREFLDRYCPLSDPRTTLEHTQHFLMESVAGETAHPKWTKALQSVLSNVPQEINLHPMSEKGAGAHSSDLAVLTVENKITVAQNGAAYPKKLKTRTPVGKGAPPAENVTAEGLAPPRRAPTLGNRKRREEEDGIQTSGGPELAKEGEATPPRCASAKRRRKRRNVRRKRRVRWKKGNKRAAGLPLKIVLKKNPVKEKQWVSQSCGGAPDRGPGQAGLHAPPEQTAPVLLSESCQSGRTWASKPDSPDHRGAVAGTPQAEPEGSSRADAGLCSQDSPQVSQVDAGVEAGRRDAASTLLRRSGGGGGGSGSGVDFLTAGNQRSPGAGGGTARSMSAPSQAPITLQGRSSGGVLSAAVSPEKSDERRRRDGEAPADSGPDLCSHADAPAAPPRQAAPSRRPVPKSVERTLKLVAISPYQPVRRPAGNQPVVVLNHPDADVPEVARVMEVINRYKGAVRKVALSRRTLKALCALPEAREAELDGDGPVCVQERFLLKLKLRRLSGKKYQVVGGASPSRGPTLSLCCWFCGRVFTSQEMWVIHRQRHLVEWK